jgi:hypothetical protein
MGKCFAGRVAWSIYKMVLERNTSSIYSSADTFMIIFEVARY